MRKSINPYTEDWAKVALETKEAAGWKCIRCGRAHDSKAGYCLTVHHLDMDPANNAWWNLAALCQRCHLKIQAKVIMEQPWLFEHSEWFKPYVAGYYAHLLGVEETREFVTTNMNGLIQQGVKLCQA